MSCSPWDMAMHTFCISFDGPVNWQQCVPKLFLSLVKKFDILFIILKLNNRPLGGPPFIMFTHKNSSTTHHWVEPSLEYLCTKTTQQHVIWTNPLLECSNAKTTWQLIIGGGTLSKMPMYKKQLCSLPLGGPHSRCLNTILGLRDVSGMIYCCFIHRTTGTRVLHASDLQMEHVEHRSSMLLLLNKS